MPEKLINVVTRDGQVVAVPPERVDEFMRQGGRLLTQGEEVGLQADIDREKEYGSAGQKWQAFGEGGLRGLTFGLSDLVHPDPEGAAARRELHTGRAILGEIPGLAAGALSTGGASLPSRLAAASPAGLSTRAAIKAGSKFENLAVRGLVEGATEAGLYGAGAALSQAALTDDPLTVESMVASVTSHALFGGALGGIVGGRAELWNRGRNWLGRSLEDQGAVARQTISKEATRHLRETDQAVTRGLRHADDLAGEQAALAGIRGPVKRSPAEQLELDLPAQQGLPFQERTPPELFGRGPRRRFERDQRKAMEHARPESPRGPQQELALGPTPARQLELPGTTGPGRLPPQAAGPVTSRPARMGSEAASLASQFQAARQGTEALEGAYKAARSALQRRLGKEMDLDLEKFTRLKPNEALKTLQAVDSFEQAARQVGSGPVDGSALMERLVSLPDKASRQLQALAKLEPDVLSKAFGREVPQFGPTADLLSRLYTVNRLGDSLTKTGTTGFKTLDRGFKAGFGVLAFRARLGKGNPFKRALQAMAISRARDVAGSVLRKGEGVVTKAETIGERVGNAVTKLSRFPGPRARPALLATPRALWSNLQFDPQAEKDKGVKGRMQELARATSNPERLTRFLDEQTAPLRAINPQLGYAVTDTLAAKYAYMKATMPALHRYGLKGVGEPAPSEVAKWARIVKALEDPLSVVDDLGNLNLTREAVEAVQTVYPALYEEIRNNLMESVGELREELPYTARLQLSLLFRVPVEATAAPEVVAGLQQILNAPPKQPVQMQPRQGTPGPIPTAEPTTAQRLTER